LFEQNIKSLKIKNNKKISLPLPSGKIGEVQKQRKYKPGFKKERQGCK